METILPFLSDYGYAAIYMLLTLGIIGLPIPDEVLMTTVGYLTSIGTMKFSYALFFSFTGAMSGMILSYFIGKKAGRPFLERYGKWVGLKPSRIAKAEKWMNKYGPISIVIGYFIPGIRHITCYLSGISRMSFNKYIIYSSIGALIWCLIFIVTGRVLGHVTV
ncbi:DedA family protein [Planococcus sp. CAU13]|uniref:DedA family protein n=1 Tax=Planococcus sp. CAU13 TaxID=1541197 RepID=UPI00052FF353|nr:DedA family protein [Planococcus sp. CAU13]